MGRLASIVIWRRHVVFEYGHFPDAWAMCVRYRPRRSTAPRDCARQPARSVGSRRYQAVGNDVASNRAFYQLGTFTHPISQFGHACSRLRLCCPRTFGGPLGIRKIMAIGAPMQTRPQAASLIAYQFGQFHPGLLEVRFTARSDFPSEVNCVHTIWSGWPIPALQRAELPSVRVCCYRHKQRCRCGRRGEWPMLPMAPASIRRP